MIALSSEMSGAMTISQISWQRGGSSGAASGNYNNFKLYVGLASVSELTDTYADNYIPGTRTLVYQTASQVMSAGTDEWVTITLDTPFWYNGVDNVIVELEWVGGANMFYTYMWETGANRGLMNKTSVGAPTGTLSTKMSELMFDGDMALEQHTFGYIKALWSF
ncbi:MAG: hypothetical protein KAR44_10665 [Candidatus Aegiribacteria sp.]|nr:hypothetical protein [Candidatus Aegiribacteria sp.]